MIALPGTQRRGPFRRPATSSKDPARASPSIAGSEASGAQSTLRRECREGVKVRNTVPTPIGELLRQH